MIALYMDENVDRAVTRGLRRRGVDVLTVQEDGRASLPDPDVMDRAGALGRVLFSQDRDMLAISAQRQAEGVPFGGLIFGPQNQALVGRYVEDIDLVAQGETFEEYADRVQYLPL